MTFEDFINKKDTEPENKSIQKNNSQTYFNETKSKNKDEDEISSVFENTRRGMRQPLKDQMD